MAKIDLGAIINQGVQTGFAWLNKTIGVGANPLVTQGQQGQVKVGNVGGIFGINLSVTTLLLIAGGIVGTILIARKL